MKQYERIVSYLYRYEGEKKQENSGYAKIESRETECRIQMQTRLAAPIRGAKAYFYHQNPNGIETVTIGEMQVSRSEMHCKTKTLTDNLFGSGKKFEDMDGILIHFGTTVCYATTWKNDYFYLGDWKPDKEEAAEVQEQDKQKEQAEGRQPQDVFHEAEEQKQDVFHEAVEQKQEAVRETEEQKQEAYYETVEKSQEDQEEVRQQIQTESEEEVFAEDELQMAEMLPEEGSEVMERTDFGYRILKTFPTMYPFQDTEKGSCVKMELQDIGCLPMRFWTLSGNRFLLHGYYCYRHLVFFKQNDRYYMGVPGVYNEKEKRSGLKYGFKLFRPVSEGKHQGAFGYWLMMLN